MAALANIEEALRLDRGTLVHLLIASRRTGPVSSPLFPTMDVTLEQGVIDAYAALGALYPSPSRELTTHSVTDVDAHGNVARCNTRTVVQSTSGTLTGIPFLTMTPGMSTPRPRFSAISGGTVDAHYSDHSGELHGALFELDRPLKSPDTAVVEWAIEYPPDFPPMKDSGHAVARKGRELLTWVRFHPDAVPDWCDEVVKTPKGVTVTPLCVKGVTAVHRVRRGFGPGAVEIAWGYGPRE